MQQRWLCSRGVWHAQDTCCGCPSPWKGVAIVINCAQVYSFRRTRDAQRFFAQLNKSACALVQVFPIRKGVVQYV